MTSLMDALKPHASGFICHHDIYDAGVKLLVSVCLIPDTWG